MTGPHAATRIDKPARRALKYRPRCKDSTIQDLHHGQAFCLALAREQAGEFELMSKKEAAKLRDKLEKLRGVLGGMRRMRRAPGMVFVIDPKLPKDVTTITLSYTFFEVGGKTPAAPTAPLAAAVQTLPVKTGWGS